MTATKVRVDYESLAGMAARFGAQAGDTRQTLQQLLRQVEVLQDGDWVGQGANTFYQEITATVLPRVRRLAAALEAAQDTTSQIRQIMQQAEAEAARVLRGEGQGEPATGAGQTALFAASGGSPGGAAGGPPLGGPAPAGSPAGDAAGGSAAPLKDTPLSQPLADAVKRILAEENAAVDRVLAGLNPNVRAIVKQSPTLRAQLLQIEKLNFNIQIASGGDSSTNHHPHEIIIAQQANDLATVAHVAHEAGHAVNEPNLIRIKYADTTHDQYVAPNTEIMLRNEGLAAFNETQVRAELLAAGGPDISTGKGGPTPAYRQVFADYTAGNLTREQALEQMTRMMAREPRGRARNGTYESFYREHFQKEWDVELDPPPSR